MRFGMKERLTIMICGMWLISKQYTPAEAPTISDGSNTEAPKPPATMPAK